MAEFDHCPLCLYPRQGLPVADACPECGHRIDPEDLFLYGDAGKPASNAYDGGTFPAIGGAIIAAIGIVSGFAWGIARGLLAAALAAIPILTLAFWRSLSKHDATLVYLTPKGYAQGSRKRGLRQLHPWNPDLEITFRFTQKAWWLSIGTQFRHDVQVRLGTDRATVETVREKLGEWQGVRVWVEE